MGKKEVGIVCYADDVVLIAETEDLIQLNNFGIQFVNIDLQNEGLGPK